MSDQFSQIEKLVGGHSVPQYPFEPNNSEFGQGGARAQQFGNPDGFDDTPAARDVDTADRRGFGEHRGYCQIDLGNGFEWKVIWFPCRVEGSNPGSGGSGSSGSSGGSRGSSKNTAIVPGPDGRYREWYAMEATQVLFFDFMEVTVPRGKSNHQIDPVVYFCIEKDTLRAFVSQERGAATARVSGDTVTVNARHFPIPRKQSVQIMLYGVRRGFRHVRLAYSTFEAFVDNECRLNPRMTREEVLAALAKEGVTE